MKMSLFITLLSVFVSTNSFAADLNCEATTILFEGSGLKIGDQISFNEDRSVLTAKNIRLSCKMGLADKLNASMILGCGDGSDQDFYIFSKDTNTVELMDMAIYTCK